VVLLLIKQYKEQNNDTFSTLRKTLFPHYAGWRNNHTAYRIP